MKTNTIELFQKLKNDGKFILHLVLFGMCIFVLGFKIGSELQESHYRKIAINMGCAVYVVDNKETGETVFTWISK